MGERVLGLEQEMESDLTWGPQGSSVRMENKVITDRRSKVIRSKVHQGHGEKPEGTEKSEVGEVRKETA